MSSALRVNEGLTLPAVFRQSHPKAAETFVIGDWLFVIVDQNVNRSASCNVLGSPTEVVWPNVGDGFVG